MPEHDRKILNKEELEQNLKNLKKELSVPFIKINESKNSNKWIDYDEYLYSKGYRTGTLKLNKDNLDDFTCTNSNCIRRNKCSRYLSKKGFSKPGVMIDNGNSCKQFNPK